MKILFLISFLLFYSCGVTKMSQNDVSNETITAQTNASTSCLCASEYMPVCGTDNKSYDNACLAQCFGIKSFRVGQCTCGQTLMVCGSDGVDYSECDALNKKITIIKYSPCSSSTI